MLRGRLSFGNGVAMARNEEVETQWTGHDLYDVNGEKIGTIEDVRFGELVGNLQWLVVKTGLFGTKKVYVPAGEVSSSAGRFVVSYGKDRVQDAPHVKDRLAALPEVEEKLCTYYGLDYVRSVAEATDGCVDPQEESPAGVEQVARAFVKSMNDSEKLRELLTLDALASGGVLPQAMPAMEALGMMNALTTAMPDLDLEIEQVAVEGNQATVKVNWSGTQSGPLSLPLPGMPALPPSGKKVSMKDAYIVTVQRDKVSHIHVESPADGGIPAVLKQLGVEAPGM